MRWLLQVWASSGGKEGGVVLLEFRLGVNPSQGDALEFYLIPDNTISRVFRVYPFMGI